MSGISNLKNCFEKNQFNTSIPPGLQLFNSCSFSLLPMGSDLHGLWNLIARVINANSGEYEKGNWKEFDSPNQQPNMPIMQMVIDQNYRFDQFKNSINPAINVFDRYRSKLDQIQLPQEAYQYFDENPLQ